MLYRLGPLKFSSRHTNLESLWHSKASEILSVFDINPKHFDQSMHIVISLSNSSMENKSESYRYVLDQKAVWIQESWIVPAYLDVFNAL